MNDFGAVRAYYRVIASRARTRGKSGRNRTAGFGPPGGDANKYRSVTIMALPDISFRYSKFPI